MSRIDRYGEDRLKLYAMYKCILNVPMRNDWSKVTYLHVHDSPVFKTHHSKVSTGFPQQDLQSSYNFGNI